MNRMPISSLDLPPTYRDGYGQGVPISTDRNRSRVSGSELDYAEDIGYPLKALELRELQEEENWIKNLKMQRDKVEVRQIEEFRAEIEARDYKIRNLEEEVLRLKGSASEIIKLQAALDKSETQVRIRDKDLALQSDQFKKQLKEYQTSLEDMKSVLRQDQDQSQREIQKCDSLRIRLQSQKDQEEITHLRSEYEKNRGFKAHSEELIDTIRRECKEREIQLQEQLQSTRSVEKQLKDQLASIAYEKAGVEGKLKDLFVIVTEQERQLNSMKDVETSYQDAEDRVEQFKSENEKLKYELVLIKESKETSKVRASEDFKLLKEDLDMCTQLVKRQEQTIAELRKRKMEDDQEIQSLNVKVQKMQKEVGLMRDSGKNEVEERTQISKKMETMSSELERLRAENVDLSTQLSAMIEKEAVERRQKEEYARLRLDLINMRNKEMTAFANALEGVATKRYDI